MLSWLFDTKITYKLRFILVFVISVGILFIWNIEKLTNQIYQTKDLLLANFGMGFVMPGLCISTMIFCWALKREILSKKYWKLWLGLGVLSFIAWGLMAILPNPYPRTYPNSFGGNIGQYIAGQSNLEAIIRFSLTIIFVFVIVSPARSFATVTKFFRIIIFVSSMLLYTLGKYIKRLLFVGLMQRRKIFKQLPVLKRKKQDRTISVAEARVPVVPGPSISSRIVSARKTPVNQFEEMLTRPDKVQSVVVDVNLLTKNISKPTMEDDSGVSISIEDIEKWNTPAISMLILPPPGSQNPDIGQEKTSLLIENTLADYGIEVTVDEVKPGPVVTMFGLVPGWNRKSKNVRERNAEGKVAFDNLGNPIITKVEDKTRVRVDSIVAREKDLALALAAPSLRIEAPIPGASLVGIEVPNPKPAIVTLRSVMETQTFTSLSNKSKLTLGLGLGTGGEVAAADLAKMPHLLIAGSTGSGKSVCINSVIASIIMQNSPWETRMLLIDPKRVELTPYNGIPHLIEPVIVEVEQAVLVLKGMIQEMLRRYKIFEEASVRNIEGYNEKRSLVEKMPFLVVAVDELADLMMSASSDIERSITRLAQLGRATGIHLVVATQRPSVDVVTGLIKANFPSRISFAVASQVDSRTILDSVGAEKLLGRGDMLFQPSDMPKPKRIQGAFISDTEIEKIVEHWKNLKGPPPPKITLQFDDVITNRGFRSEDRDDELFDKALEVASQYNRMSTSLLQRRLKIGYPRAARIMDILEERGVVGPGEAGKSRDVIG